MVDRGIRTTVHMEGLDQLRRNLQELPKNVQERVLPNAVAKGALLIRDAARRLAPVLKIPTPYRTAGLLQRMIRSTRGVKRSTEASAFVSVRRLSKSAISKFKRTTGKSSAQNPNDPFYWRFVEFGTSKIPAVPFLRNAFNSEKEKAAERIKEALAKGIEKEVERLPKHKGR